MDLDDLVARAKEGAVSNDEIERIAVGLSGGTVPQDQTYQMVYVLGRTGSKAHEDLVASFIGCSDDTQVAALALSIICNHWGLAAKYRQQLIEALRGYSWDESEEVRDAAISASGELLATARDCGLLKELLRIAQDEADQLTTRLSLEALARATGASYTSAVMPRDPAQAVVWAQDVRSRADARYKEECISAHRL